MSAFSCDWRVHGQAHLKEKYMRRHNVLLASAAVLLLATAACGRDLPTGASGSEGDIAFARQTASYSVSLIDLLSGDHENRASGVNDAGEVVGTTVGRPNGTLNEFRAYVTLGGVVTPLAGSGGFGLAISNGATRYVVGRSSFLPARWTIVGTSAGAPVSLPVGAASQGSALGVNDAGDAVGYAGNSAAIWDAAGNLTLVATPSGFVDGEGRDIDNAGNAVFVFTRPEAGWEGGVAIGYIRTAAGQLIALPPLSGDVVSYANGLGPASGNLVRVAGSSYSAPSMSRAVRWTVDLATGSIVSTEVRSEASHALALADDGATAGFTDGPLRSLKSTAFRWHGGTLLSLNPPKGAKTGRAWAISPNGRYIVGESILQSRRATLWTFPAP
jgi:uncharacterized membrane protein